MEDDTTRIVDVLHPVHDVSGVIYGFLEAQDIFRLGQTNRTLRNQIHDPGFQVRFLAQRSLREGLKFTTFRQLLVYEAMQALGLIQENRIGFRMFAIHPNTNEGEYGQGEEPHNSIEVKNSRRRLLHMQSLMDRFPRIDAHVDAHCGPFAPADQAHKLSQSRAMVVVDWLIRDRPSRSERVSSSTWGLRVFRLLQEPHMASHPHHRTAEFCMPFCAVFFVVDGMTLPPRPSYYPDFRPTL